LQWSLQLLSFLAFYVSRGRAGRSNTSLRTLCFHFAVTCHPRAMCRVILFCSALTRTHDLRIFLSSIQMFCCKTFSMLWYDTSYRTTIPHIVACVCTPVCHHLYTIFHRRLRCAYASPSTYQFPFIFWHLIFSCPSSYCIPYSIIKCRMMILMSYFSCLAARFFPREDCSIRPLAPHFAYLWN